MVSRLIPPGGIDDVAKSMREARKHANEQRKISQDATRYLKAQSFLVDLRKKYLHRRITGQQYSRLRHDALNGNMDSAHEKLEQILYGNGGEK